MADDQGEETIGFKRNREANIATAGFIALIGFSFAIEAFPILTIIAWASFGLVILWLVWLFWLQGAIIDWQTDRDMRRPVTMEIPATQPARPSGSAPSRE
jgi:fatty acid desaturase